MIRIYYLETERIGNTDTVKGIQYIHNAILDVEDRLRKLIQDTTDAEHAGLNAVAKSWREASAAEIAQLETLPAPAPVVAMPKFAAASFVPPTIDGLKQHIEYIEEFLKERYP